MLCIHEPYIHVYTIKISGSVPKLISKTVHICQDTSSMSVAEKREHYYFYNYGTCILSTIYRPGLKSCDLSAMFIFNY